MVLARASVCVVEQVPQNDCCQYLCPQSELWLPPVSPEGSPRQASGSDPVQSTSVQSSPVQFSPA